MCGVCGSVCVFGKGDVDIVRPINFKYNASLNSICVRTPYSNDYGDDAFEISTTTPP